MRNLHPWIDRDELVSFILKTRHVLRFQEGVMEVPKRVVQNLVQIENFLLKI